MLPGSRPECKRVIDVRAVGGDEVDQRLLVLDVEREVVPALVRRERRSRRSPRATDGARTLSGGTPSLRPRARLSTARSQRAARGGWLRNASVTNSSMWLPDLARPAHGRSRRRPATAVSRPAGPPSLNSSGLRKPVEQRDVVGVSRPRTCAAIVLGQHRVARGGRPAWANSADDRRDRCRSGS